MERQLDLKYSGQLMERRLRGLGKTRAWRQRFCAVLQWCALAGAAPARARQTCACASISVRFFRGADSSILSLLRPRRRRSTINLRRWPAARAPFHEYPAGSHIAPPNASMEVLAVTPLVGLGCLAKPPIAQDEPSTLQLRFYPDPLDVAFEADGVAVQLMFHLEHLADLHQQLVVRKPVAHLVGGGTMRIGTQNRPQPSQVSRQLLNRNPLLVTQFAYGAPMRDRRRTPLSPPVDAPIPPPGQQIVDDHTQNRDEHHDCDGNTTKYHLVQVHRHEITLSRAPRVH